MGRRGGTPSIKCTCCSLTPAGGTAGGPTPAPSQGRKIPSSRWCFPGQRSEPALAYKYYLRAGERIGLEAKTAASYSQFIGRLLPLLSPSWDGEESRARDHRTRHQPMKLEVQSGSDVSWRGRVPRGSRRESTQSVRRSDQVTACSHVVPALSVRPPLVSSQGFGGGRAQRRCLQQECQ